MAYRCSGTTNQQLIANMRTSGLINSDIVEAAFKKVDRKNYVLDESDAYIDAPQPIKCNATISAPHMHAEATTNLLPFLKPGSRVLDVGSGSGYTAAIFHQLVRSDSLEGAGPSGKVVGIDHMTELVAWSIENLRKDGLGSALESGEVEMVVGDGRKGWPAAAPYDAIHVGAAAPEIPKELIDQLKAPGRMFIPVGTGLQKIFQVDKDQAGNVTQKPLLDVMYVPLTDQATQARKFF
ncbi:protein-L-isoaspartate O-methyltransferase [Fomitiporia mediterranea MF3/22]|uniref:protein-L-isoaspartate O-methyltransferase n=1 Tax=Fomitiporia mediterranea (strain MF3/22) TaxID=694068 RepID=UPI00044094C6|nr:protein-L-isoaspartate O-methyltransferase [Fomitiporia mediterranea MF3/22]EJD00174.1 protein-L-isoaspartate O-methyltransferase [Fomitiporia mediterranea MF3/22]